MANKILIPTPLRPFTGKQDAVEVDGTTIGELLANLTTKYAGLKPHLYNEQGKLRSFVNVYLNDEDIRYLEKEKTAVKAGVLSRRKSSVQRTWNEKDGHNARSVQGATVAHDTVASETKSVSEIHFENLSPVSSRPLLCIPGPAVGLGPPNLMSTRGGRVQLGRG